MTFTELASLHGVETEYTNTFGEVIRATPASLEAILKLLGALREGESIEAAIERRKRELDSEWLPPVLVLAVGQRSVQLSRLPSEAVSWSLLDEEGTDLAAGQSNSATVDLGLPLKAGYYDLQLSSAKERRSALLIVAPELVYQRSSRRRRWAPFAPLYALRDRRDWGIGDFGTARRAVELFSTRGASAFATLPLLATYLDELFDPSPYAPVSRLFWNEIFIDLSDLRSSLESPWQAAIEALRSSRLVDYREVARLKRPLLEQRATELTTSAGHEREQFEQFRASPELRRYSRFRALTEQRRRSWREWSDVVRGGEIPQQECEPGRVAYHSTVQFLSSNQLAELSSYSRERDCGLFLDFPLGSNPDGFDVWNHPDLYVDGAITGAPPDLSYPQGQSWGFRPLHPEAMRRDRYRHWIACVRTQLEHASILRLDHVMGLHRLYWIPRGFAAHEGVYVRYKADELFAILAIESQRSQTEIIGEDLGTVPEVVRELMARHGVLGLYVLERQLTHYPDLAPAEPAPRKVVSINNHDLPPFASFVAGLDLDEKAELGVIPPTRIEAERAKRARAMATLRNWGGESEAGALYRKSLGHLMDSAGELVVVTLEDLWGETFAQNIPTTSTERPNWRHKLGRPVEEMDDDDLWWFSGP